MTHPVAGGIEANAPSTAPPDRPGFAHASEAEFARILDFYQVDWRYEPHVFPILWSIDGDVLESFAPDFYLPELDLYVEMTTLRQKLVRKKNRKLRRLRELYPDIRIKLFYARDFRALMLKYGRVALADALSGAEGQFTPDNPGPPVSAPAGDGDAARGLPPTVASDAIGMSPASTASRPGEPDAPAEPDPHGPAPRLPSREPRRHAPSAPGGRTARAATSKRGIIGADTRAGSAARTRDEGAAR